MKPKKRPGTDRRVRQSENLAHVIRVYQLIHSRNGPWNPKTITRELCCSERTVYRDLQILSMAGVPWFFDDICDTYRVTPGFKFPGLPSEPESVSPTLSASAFLINEARTASKQLLASAERATQVLLTLTKLLEQTEQRK
ncbi:MAG TPA: HTH domain-containing protein [Gemmatales bacterium]|nr:HTH domain-containing protein [Gemmatales bacterium]